MIEISVIGLGAVGTSVLNGMSKYHSCIGYDIDGRGIWSDVVKSKFAFICVPTNANDDGSLDMSIIHQVVRRLNSDNFNGIIVIKSTLYPYTMKALRKEFSNLDICYMPEYLRERDAQEWFNDPDRLVITEPAQISQPVLDLFSWVDDSIPRIVMPCVDAEIAKLAHNAYIATKVTFTCEIERLCILHNANSTKIMNSIWVDRRIGNKAHLVPGLGGYDGKCVPKDTFALAKFDSDSNSLLHTVKMRGPAEIMKRKLNDARNTKSLKGKNKHSSMINEFGSFIGHLFGFILISVFLVLAAIGINALGWEDVYTPRGETKFLDSDSNVSTGDIIFATNTQFNSTGIYTTSSHQCYPNYDGGSDCSTTYTNHIKYEFEDFWFYSYNNQLNICLNKSCDIIGEVEDSGIIRVMQWRIQDE